jgi:hypothetical protein
VLGVNEHPPVKRLRYILVILCGLMFFDARSAAAQPPPRLVHVFVALADNAHQGIVPVPAALGNGDDPAKNLYWGAAFGVRTYFKKSAEWKEVATVNNPNSYLLERSVFVHGTSGTYLIADAYRGREIKQAITDFYRSAAGLVTEGSASAKKDFPATAALSVYVGHDGLMGFAIESRFQGDAKAHREAIMLACASKMFFCRRAEKHWCSAAAVDNRIDGPRGLHAEGGTGWVDCRRIGCGRAGTRGSSVCEVPKM